MLTEANKCIRYHFIMKTLCNFCLLIIPMALPIILAKAAAAKNSRQEQKDL